MTVVAVIVAAGRGLRAGGGVPKQYWRLGSRAVLTRTLEVFLDHDGVDLVQPVTHPDDAALYRAAVADLPERLMRKLADSTPGGATRQASVRAGLEAAAAGRPTLALVHDAARPFATRDLIDAAIAAGRGGAAVPGVTVTDTIKLVDGDGRVAGTPPREALRAVQTPQAFRFDALLEAHRAAAAAGLDAFTDDGAIAEWAGHPVAVFPGDPLNVKLTRSGDFEEAQRRLEETSMRYLTRVGAGFDVHAFTDGDHVWLGGVRIPHERGLLAQSDGDVALHALCDALFGAIADGDIGVHFPPSDPQWKDASSDRFLSFAADRVRKRGGIIDHLDVTILGEAPRVGPHREAIRDRIAAICGVPLDHVAIKATTTEKLGFTGRREGIAAQATATIRLPQVDA